MSAIYVETSAVLAWLLGQNGAAEVRRAVDEADAAVTTVLTFTEASRALVRAETDGIIRGGDALRLRGALERARTGWMCMTVSEDVLARASRPFPEEPVRTLDAVHLATALEFTQALADLRMLSFDTRILRNAEALGLL